MGRPAQPNAGRHSGPEWAALPMVIELTGAESDGQAYPLRGMVCALTVGVIKSRGLKVAIELWGPAQRAERALVGLAPARTRFDSIPSTWSRKVQGGPNPPRSGRSGNPKRPRDLGSCEVNWMGRTVKLRCRAPGPVTTFFCSGGACTVAGTEGSRRRPICHTWNPRGISKARNAVGDREFRQAMQGWQGNPRATQYPNIVEVISDPRSNSLRAGGRETIVDRLEKDTSWPRSTTR